MDFVFYRLRTNAGRRSRHQLKDFLSLGDVGCSHRLSRTRIGRSFGEYFDSPAFLGNAAQSKSFKEADAA
jgi:hypothetical protein